MRAPKRKKGAEQEENGDRKTDRFYYSDWEDGIGDVWLLTDLENRRRLEGK